MKIFGATIESLTKERGGSAGLSIEGPAIFRAHATYCVPADPVGVCFISTGNFSAVSAASNASGFGFCDPATGSRWPKSPCIGWNAEIGGWAPAGTRKADGLLACC